MTLCAILRKTKKLKNSWTVYQIDFPFEIIMYLGLFHRFASKSDKSIFRHFWPFSQNFKKTESLNNFWRTYRIEAKLIAFESPWKTEQICCGRQKSWLCKILRYWYVDFFRTRRPRYEKSIPKIWITHERYIRLRFRLEIKCF